MSLTESVFSWNLYSAEGQKFCLRWCQDLPLSHLPGRCGEVGGHLCCLKGLVGPSGIRCQGWIVIICLHWLWWRHPCFFWPLVSGPLSLVMCGTTLCLWLTKLVECKSHIKCSYTHSHSHTHIEGYKETLEVLNISLTLIAVIVFHVCMHTSKPIKLRT